MKYTIFVVEDDASLQELYAYSLENDFSYRCFADAQSLYAALPLGLPDLILLDIMLPGDDGFTVLSRIKATKDTAHIPVIMVSAKNEEISKVKCLNMGADDYIAKPFGVLELIARIKANLRKYNRISADTTLYKDIVINSAKHQIIINGQTIQTTLKEYNLLSLLCAHAEQVMGREAIFTEVWGDNFIGETRTLDIHIKELRKKLNESASDAVIQTIRGVGYMLT